MRYGIVMPSLFIQKKIKTLVILVEEFERNVNYSR